MFTYSMNIWQLSRLLHLIEIVWVRFSTVKYEFSKNICQNSLNTAILWDWRMFCKILRVRRCDGGGGRATPSPDAWARLGCHSGPAWAEHPYLHPANGNEATIRDPGIRLGTGAPATNLVILPSAHKALTPSSFHLPICRSCRINIATFTSVNLVETSCTFHVHTIFHLT